MINFFFKNKITIIDAGVHKGDFLRKKIGLKKISKALMIDPVMQENIKKLASKKFKFLNMALGNKKCGGGFGFTFILKNIQSGHHYIQYLKSHHTILIIKNI